MTLSLADRVRLHLDPKLHLKDPTTSELGLAIVGTGILMIDEMGYETFTFRKLAERIGTTEASVYRYFKNKHRLLLYSIAWLGRGWSIGSASPRPAWWLRGSACGWRSTS